MMTSEERRLKFRKGLSSLYTPIYDALCAELPPEWAPFYGVRTFDEQTGLYAQGRATGVKGRIVTNARAGESPHNYGCASDWTLWDSHGQPIWLEGHELKWLVYKNACEKVGAKWGGDFSNVDRPHNELHIACSWKQVHVAYLANNNMTQAQEFIQERIVK